MAEQNEFGGGFVFEGVVYTSEEDMPDNAKQMMKELRKNTTGEDAAGFGAPEQSNPMNEPLVRAEDVNAAEGAGKEDQAARAKRNR